MKKTKTQITEAKPDNALRSSGAVGFVESARSEKGLEEIISKVATLVKSETRKNIRFFPLSVAKTWILLYYVPNDQNRLTLLEDDIISAELKLKSTKEERLKKLAQTPSFAKLFSLNKEGFENFVENYLLCPCFFKLSGDVGPVDENEENAEFFSLFDDLFVKTSFFGHEPTEENAASVPSTSSGPGTVELEPNETKLCKSWEKLVFLLKLYKTPRNSFDDMALWKGTYNKKFAESKATMLSKFPTLPVSLISFVIKFMGWGD